MYQSENLEVWNLTPGTIVAVGQQSIFNVLGRVTRPEQTRALLYRLNGGPERPAYFNPGPKRDGRLHCPGDFNIDTIDTDQLGDENEIVLRLVDQAGGSEEHRIVFGARPFADPQPRFRLDLRDVQYPEQVGQIIDGPWRIGRGETGERCLEITPEDAGYDRIMLFGSATWGSCYEITARLSVTQWSSVVHNVGLLFKWNPHLRGDGTHLPVQWSTGLAYYASQTAGLRVRYGVDVHVDEQGNKVGSYVLGEAPYSVLHQWAQRFRASRPPHNQGIIAQLATGKHYWFKAVIHPDRHELTVWQDGKRQPAPQIALQRPTEWLTHGSVGVIFYNCGGRLYEYEVTPLG